VQVENAVDTTGDELAVALRLLEHLRAGTTDREESDLRIPAWHYFDEERATQERAVFRTRPLLATVTSALPGPGAFVTQELLGVPLLVVRQDDGSVAAFRNICRHRGGRVEADPCGSRRVFTCRYHGWTYDRDGGLRHVPFADGFESVEPACHGLLPVGAAELHGLVFVNLASAEPPDVADWLGPELGDQLASYDLDRWSLHIEEDFTQPLNWKLVADGLLDVLHPKFLHPDSVGRLIQTNTHTWDRYGHHARLAMARRKLDKIRDAIPPGTDLRTYVITNYFVYPNVMIVAQPDHFELWSVYPDATSPERSTTSIRFLVPEPPATEEAAALLDQQWAILRDAVLGEDWPMAETIQRAARIVASGDGTDKTEFVFGRNETPLQHLHRRLAQDLGAGERVISLS
jgi:phenylpropionate dioxygenase-like ring-hydroxylating dioxygenase large terminal subunit